MKSCESGSGCAGCARETATLHERIADGLAREKAAGEFMRAQDEVIAALRAALVKNSV